MKMDKKPKCEGCDSSFVYVKTDGLIVCRRCGHITKQNIEKEECED